jgi:hypothetical protein
VISKPAGEISLDGGRPGSTKSYGNEELCFATRNSVRHACRHPGNESLLRSTSGRPRGGSKTSTVHSRSKVCCPARAKRGGRNCGVWPDRLVRSARLRSTIPQGVETSPGSGSLFLNPVAMALQPTCGIEMDVQHIDAVIRERGFCLMKEEQLKQLFPEENCNSKRFLLLATLACERGWSFEFQPHNGDLRFAPLPAVESN